MSVYFTDLLWLKLLKLWVWDLFNCLYTLLIRFWFIRILRWYWLYRKSFFYSGCLVGGNLVSIWVINGFIHWIFRGLYLILQFFLSLLQNEISWTVNQMSESLLVLICKYKPLKFELIQQKLTPRNIPRERTCFILIIFLEYNLLLNKVYVIPHLISILSVESQIISAA